MLVFIKTLEDAPRGGFYRERAATIVSMSMILFNLLY